MNNQTYHEIYTEDIKALRYVGEHSNMIYEELDETFAAPDDSIKPLRQLL